MEIGLIIKVSKLCNLRCTYCYEFPELANRARMSIDDIRRMFWNLKDFTGDSGGKNDHRLNLIWHGGEPFAQPVSYWESIINLQKEVFGEEFLKKSIINSVQSNLTLLTKKHLPLLKNHLQLGFSYDVINDYRVSAGGRETSSVVEQKVKWLQSEGIRLGGIAVISKANIGSPKTIAEYFLGRRIPFRVLPIYMSLDQFSQIQDAAPPYDAYLEFLKTLYELPVTLTAMKEGIGINPYFQAFKIISNRDHQVTMPLPREQAHWAEWVLGVNTNGDVYSPGDLYDPAFRYGNIFLDSMKKILSSEGRKKRATRSLKRMNQVCYQCPFFNKGCLGLYVAHATPEEYREYERKGICYTGWLAQFIDSSGLHENSGPGSKQVEASQNALSELVL